MKYHQFQWQFDTITEAEAASDLLSRNPTTLGRIIIGFRGKKGAGKDTAVASCPGLQRVAFADKLREAVGLIYGLTHAQLMDPILKETVDDFWGLTPRFILQRFGTEVTRSIHPETWIWSLQRQVDKDTDSSVWPPIEVSDGSRRVWQVEVPAFAITDVRFRNEADAVKSWGGYLVEIRRPGYNGDNHASETELDGYEFDFTIDNDGSKADLSRKVADLMSVIRQRHEKIWLGRLDRRA